MAKTIRYWVIIGRTAYAYRRVPCYAYPTKTLVFRDNECYIRDPDHDYEVTP